MKNMERGMGTESVTIYYCRNNEEDIILVPTTSQNRYSPTLPNSHWQPEAGEVILWAWLVPDSFELVHEDIALHRAPDSNTYLY